MQVFILIVGPSAVGKATIARELAIKLGYSYSHGHMSIKYVRKYVDWGYPNFWNFVGDVRRATYKFMVNADFDGFIETFVWNFDDLNQQKWVEEMFSYFLNKNWEVRVVELQADVHERFLRNVEPDRLENKPSKQNTELSKSIMLEELNNSRTESTSEQWFPGKHFKIDTSHLSIEETVDRIVVWLNSISLVDDN